jgi:plastocyanin
MRPAIVLGAAAWVALVVSALAGGLALAADNPVTAGSNFFCDASKTGQVCQTNVTAGDSVTWTVESGAHTITQCTDATFTSCGSGFDSGTLIAAETYSQTFPAAGSTYYHCAFHPTEMRGVIVAAQAATPIPTPSPTQSGTSPTPLATRTPTSAAIPGTGGAPSGGSGNGLVYAMLLAGGAALLASGVSLIAARRRHP